MSERRDLKATVSGPPNPVRDLGAAIGFLTIVPVGRVWEGLRPRAVGWYAWVGWLLGGVVALPLWAAADGLGAPAEGRALLFGALVVAAWALLTRSLHWDGLADTFDGILGGQTPERRLEIMRDSRVGSFGATAIVVVALVEVAAAAVCVNGGSLWVLVAAPVLGRFAASNAAWTLPAARRDGLGLTAIERPEGYDVTVGIVAVLALAVFALGGAQNVLPLALTCVVGLVAAFVVPRVLAGRVGGMTGDLFGATVLLVEAIVLVTGALLT